MRESNLWVSQATKRRSQSRRTAVSISSFTNATTTCICPLWTVSPPPVGNLQRARRSSASAGSAPRWVIAFSAYWLFNCDLVYFPDGMPATSPSSHSPRKADFGQELSRMRTLSGNTTCTACHHASSGPVCESRAGPGRPDRCVTKAAHEEATWNATMVAGESSRAEGYCSICGQYIAMTARSCFTGRQTIRKRATCLPVPSQQPS